MQGIIIWIKKTNQIIEHYAVSVRQNDSVFFMEALDLIFKSLQQFCRFPTCTTRLQLGKHRNFMLHLPIMLFGGERDLELMLLTIVSRHVNGLIINQTTIYMYFFLLFFKEESESSQHLKWTLLLKRDNWNGKEKHQLELHK